MLNSNKHILLLCANSQSVINFRSSLIKKFILKGNKVSVIAFDDDYKLEIEQLGCEFLVLNDNNRSLNPFKILSLKNKYVNLIKNINPDVVMTFMLKPNIFGSLAAKKLKINNVYCMVEGAGDAFTYKSLKWKIIKKVICFFYKKSFKSVKKVFFLNSDDLNEFVGLKLLKEEQCVKINGIGVDLNKFEYTPLINYNKFLMVSRLKVAKGVYEYCSLARELKRKYPNVKFELLGSEGDIKVSDIQGYIDDGSISYLGFTKNVVPYLKETTCLVLLSYREGLPMSIMEALSVGRIVLTSDSIGCKETVVDGYNGYKFTLNKENDLLDKVEWIINNKNSLNEMSKCCRKFAEENYDQKNINDKIIEVVLK